MRDRLGRLLFDADICSYYRGCWFADCRLEKSVLFVPDQESGQSIAKLFGPALRRVLPDLTIRAEPFQAEKPKPSVLNAAGRKWQAQQQKLSEE